MKDIVLEVSKIKKICKEIASTLETRFTNSDSVPVFLGILKEGLRFLNDVISYYSLPVIFDTVKISTYQGLGETGVIVLEKDINVDIENKDVVLFDCVCSSGLVISYLKTYLQIKYKPRSITIAVLIDKKSARKTTIAPDIVGYYLHENRFILGYGLGYHELARNINFIFSPSFEYIDKCDQALKINKYKETRR